ncbi:hypothetical protein CHS0354_005289 [Potamilus streckersoni]|uniref:Uncharacterized protein n=1 Tax=Potamilus streckersoni TaxID=2493646 RepID=A0AAE0VUP9_9BIVA|nr:hypothetical protein CHS0354_005289 [Potamilus streckersoni]
MPLERGKMRPEDEKKIRKNFVTLKKNVDPLDLADYFIQEELFDFSDINRINSYNPNTVANRWQGFASLLFDCGPKAYETLLLALEECKYHDIVRSIRTTKSEAPKQCVSVDAENRNCSIENLQFELNQKEIKIKQLENDLERVCSQNGCFLGRTIEKSSSNDGDNLASSSQLEKSSQKNGETSSKQSDVSNSNYRTRSQSCQILNLKQALAKRVDENVTVRVMQMEVREFSREPKFMMGVTVADETRACRLILYNEKYEERVSSTSQSLLITNAINKQSHLVVTSKTDISVGPKLKIPPIVLDTIKERHQTVKAAMESPEGKLVSVKGKVAKISVSPCKRALYDRTESFTVVTIKDNTAPVNLALWGPEAENIQKGQVLALENVKVKLFNNEKRLTNTPTSKVKIISNEQLSQLSEDDDEEENLMDGTIIGLIEVEAYSSCPWMQCRNTKLRTAEKDGMLKCPKHEQLVAPEAAKLYMYARIKMVVHTVTLVEYHIPGPNFVVTDTITGHLPPKMRGREKDTPIMYAPSPHLVCPSLLHSRQATEDEKE